MATPGQQSPTFSDDDMDLLDVESAYWMNEPGKIHGLSPLQVSFQRDVTVGELCILGDLADYVFFFFPQIHSKIKKHDLIIWALQNSDKHHLVREQSLQTMFSVSMCNTIPHRIKNIAKAIAFKSLNLLNESAL